MSLRGKPLDASTLKNTTWKAFLNSKMELVDFKLISLLSEFEESKGFRDEKFNILMDFTLKNIHESDRETKEELGLMINTLMESEGQLHELIKEYFEEEFE